MNRERDMQQQQEQDWDKPANRASKDNKDNKSQSTQSKSQSTQSKAQAQSMSSDLRELPVDAATPSAAGMKECACVGPCDCATNDAIRASEEHIPTGRT